MKRGGGKSKGNSFERLVCKKLSLWLTHGKHEDCLWRSAMSGGRATVGRKSGKDHRRQAGDISAVSPEGHKLTDKFYIECKFYKDLRIGSFLFGYGPLALFWRETIRQAKQYHREPLLIAKQNAGEIIVISDHNCGDYMTAPATGRVATVFAGGSFIKAVVIYRFDNLMIGRCSL